MFLCCNEFPQITPVDAYDTLEVFNFKTTFEHKDEIESRGESCPRHWAVRDDNIKRWIQTPAVIDAFTMLILEAYEEERHQPPPCVKQDTQQFKGSDGEKMIDRFKEVVQYVDDHRKQVFTEQIKLTLERSGVQGLSSHKINDYVLKLYGNLEWPPVYGKYNITGKRSHGFNRIALREVVAFDWQQEQRNMRQTEIENIRQNARLV
jgi:hypothetical protein